MSWLSAGLCLMRVERPRPELADQAVPWLLALHEERSSLPPTGVVADLGLLLAGGVTLLRPQGLPVASDALGAALRRYEDQLLARLLADPRLEAAVDALAGLPEGLRPRGIALTVAGVLSRLGWSGEPMPASALRRQLGRGGQALLEEGSAALLADPALVERLAGELGALGQAARGVQLIGDRELFVLEHLASLDSSARRLAASQIVDVAEALGAALPRRLVRSRAQHGAAPTQLEHDSSYPTGGFASVTTSGTLENLVTSELIYMEDQPGDLFDLRYVEGELLYYSRDEASFVRRRHEIVFLLAEDLVAARVKDPGMRWQRVVTALGLVLCAVKRLTLALGHEALHLGLHFALPLEDEAALCGILFAEWRDRGVLTLERMASVPATLEALQGRASQALCDVVVVHAGGFALPERRPGARVASLSVAMPHPRLAFSGEPQREPEGPPWSAWERAALELLERMV